MAFTFLISSFNVFQSKIFGAAALAVGIHHALDDSLRSDHYRHHTCRNCVLLCLKVILIACLILFYCLCDCSRIPSLHRPHPLPCPGMELLLKWWDFHSMCPRSLCKDTISVPRRGTAGPRSSGWYSPYPQWRAACQVHTHQAEEVPQPWPDVRTASQASVLFKRLSYMFRNDDIVICIKWQKKRQTHEPECKVSKTLVNETLSTTRVSDSC